MCFVDRIMCQCSQEYSICHPQHFEKIFVQIEFSLVLQNICCQTHIHHLLVSLEASIIFNFVLPTSLFRSCTVFSIQVSYQSEVITSRRKSPRFLIEAMSLQQKHYSAATQHPWWRHLFGCLVRD